MKNVSLAILGLFLLNACKEKSPIVNEEIAETEGIALLDSSIILNGENGFYGEEFAIEGAISFEEALASLKENDSLIAKLSGTINGVCQVKGCWLTMGNDVQTMRVKFKDYGFFVPKDCAGKTVVLNGVMKKEIVSVAEQKHYLEDAEASQEEIDAIKEDKENLSFIASGVKLL